MSHSSTLSQRRARVARWLQESTCAVALTGAGISTESGIPDFRSPGGVWATSQPVMYDDFLRDADARYEYWRQKAISHRDFAGSRPNEGHLALARWQSAGRLERIVTQNIDGLHQDAGSENIVELHGTARQIACQDCGARSPAGPLVQQFLREDAVPPCQDCGGRLKHATISFGQSLDPQVLEAAVELAQRADLYFAIGSSLVVHPAAALPGLAKAAGARLVIINRDPTPADPQADIVFRESIGETLTAIDACLRSST